MAPENQGESVRHIRPDDVEPALVVNDANAYPVAGGVHDWNKRPWPFCARKPGEWIGRAGRRCAAGFAYNTRTGESMYSHVLQMGSP